MGNVAEKHPDTVLLVHADAPSRAALTGLLESNRYAVAGVSTGAEGLQVLAGGPLPCLILYVMTGDGDGSLEFRAAQTADASFAAVPIIMCTPLDVGAGDAGTSTFVSALLALVGRHCEQVGYAG